MPCCNDADTGLNVTWHENEQTSDWCLFAREFVELKLNKEIANDIREL